MHYSILYPHQTAFVPLDNIGRIWAVWKAVRQ